MNPAEILAEGWNALCYIGLLLKQRYSKYWRFTIGKFQFDTVIIYDTHIWGIAFQLLYHNRWMPDFYVPYVDVHIILGPCRYTTVMGPIDPGVKAHG